MEERSNIFHDLKNYCPEPSKKVWTKIEHQLDAPKHGHSSLKKWGIISGIGAVIVIGIVIATLNQKPKNDNFETLPISNQDTVTLVESEDTLSKIVEPALIQNITFNQPVADKEIVESSTPIIKPEPKIEPKSPNISSEKVATPEPPIIVNEQPILPERKEIVVPEIIKTEPIKTDSIIADTVVPIEYTFIDLNQNQSICRGEKAIIQIANGHNILWNTGETSKTLTVNPTESTEYQATWQEEDRYYKSSIFIEVLNCSMFVPNAFTPNGDGINDRFRPVCEGISNFRMLIFAQNGNQLFDSNNITHGWDGSYGGKKMQEDVYIYRISFTDSSGKAHNMYGTFRLLP